MPRQRRFRPTALLLTLVLGASNTTRGATPVQQGEEPVYHDTIETRVVNVEVHAMDPKGVPITDLTIEDFEIFEDGSPVEIAHFAVLGGDRPSAAPSVLPPASDAASSPFEQIEPAPASARPIWLAIFIDNLSLRPGERRRLLPQLRTFVARQLGSETRIMVVSFDRSLSVLQAFTSDRAAACAGLEKVADTPPMGMRHDATRRDLLQTIDSSHSSVEMAAALKPYANAIAHDRGLTADALESTIQQLAGLPGRRAVLYVGSGLPRIAAGELFWAIEHKFADGQALYQMLLYDASTRFERLASLANAQGVTLHVLDSGGIRALAAAAVESELTRTLQIPASLDTDLRANLQEPLVQLAERTGGWAVVNRNDALRGLERISRDLRAYYSLGYVLHRPADQRYHSIRVKVSRDKTRLRYREGYLDKSSRQQLVDTLRASLLHPLRLNPLEVGLEIGGASAKGDGRFVVPLEIEIPLRGVTLLEDGADLSGAVRLFLVAMDHEGQVSDVVERSLDIRIRDRLAEETRAELWSVRHQLIMRDGEHRLAIAARDETSGVTSYLVGTTRVGS